MGAEEGADGGGDGDGDCRGCHRHRTGDRRQPVHVERAVAPYRRELATEAKATLRFETPRGRQLQIDFGDSLARIRGDPLNLLRPTPMI